MKPKPTLPKGRVMYYEADCDGQIFRVEAFKLRTCLKTGAFIPCTSTKQARALLKLHNTPREELVGRVVKSIKKLNTIDQLNWNTVAEAAVKEILP